MRRAPRPGSRVEFCPNPASLMLYTRPPPSGTAGTVTTMGGLPGGRSHFMRGPGGGLLYVDWDGFGTMGVSLFDVYPEGKSPCPGPGEKFRVLEGDDDERWDSFNYGELPPRAVFMRHYEKELGTKLYPMELVDSDVDAIDHCFALVNTRYANVETFMGRYGKQGIRMDADALYALISCLVEHGNDAALDFASSVLQTLNIEWV